MCDEEINKIKLLMNQSSINAKQRKCIQAALDRAEETGSPAAAIELPDGRIVTGKTSSLLPRATKSSLSTSMNYSQKTAPTRLKSTISCLTFALRNTAITSESLSHARR
jgi:uncharacterized protein (UPF0371 family)